MKTPKVLFISLRSFSITGGIENVCKSIAFHFNQRHQQKEIVFKMIALYDQAPNDKYIDPMLFHSFSRKKLSGFIYSVKSGLSQDMVVLSHINLSPIGLLIKLLRPKTKIVLWTHGIEVWRPINLIKRRFLKKVDQIVAVSGFTAESLSLWHKVHPKKVTIIPNALDPYYQFPQLRDTSKQIQLHYALKNCPIFMAVCRIASTEKHKNYDLVVRVLATLKKEGYPSFYLLCGKYEETEHQRLKKIAKETDFEENLVLPGYLEHKKIIELQMAANAFILPSSKEGFGLVFIEAQAAGLRVLAGNQDGSKEAIKNKMAGKFVDPTDSDSLKRILKNFMQNPLSVNEKLSIQENCKREFSYQNFNQHLKKIVI